MTMWNNYKHTFVRSRWQIIGWGLILGLYGAWLVSFYDNFKGMQDQLLDLLASYPPELLAAVGMSSPDELSSVSGFLNIYVFSYLPLIVGILAVLAGSGLLAADEESGVLDLIIGHPVSRRRLFMGRLLAFATTLSAIMALMWVGLAIGTTTVDIGINPVDYVLPLVSLLVTLFFFGTLALMASMLLPSRKLAGMLTGAVLAASFLLTMLGNMDPSFSTISDLSPLSYYQGGKAIEQVEWVWMAGLSATSAVFAAVALWRFQKREIRVAGERGFSFPRLRLRRKVQA